MNIDKTLQVIQSLSILGGGTRNRTHNFVLARQALVPLSYIPSPRVYRFEKQIKHQIYNIITLFTREILDSYINSTQIGLKNQGQLKILIFHQNKILNPPKSYNSKFI